MLKILEFILLQAGYQAALGNYAMERERGKNKQGNPPSVVFKRPLKLPVPSAMETFFSQSLGYSSETASVIVSILKECLVNFSQGVDPSKINNFLLYLYSSE